MPVKKANEWVGYWSNIGIFLTFALSLTLRSGYSYGATMLLLGALGLFLCQRQRFRISWNRVDTLLLMTFVIYGLSFIFFRFVHVVEMTGFDKPSRFVLVLLVYCFLRKYPPRREWIWFGVSLGAFSGAILALYQRLAFDNMRVGGFMHPIMFGDIGALLGLLSFVGLVYFWSERHFIQASFMVIGGISGLIVSVLSGSRGGWIAIPMALVYIFWQSRDLIGRLRAKVILVFFAVAAVLVVSIPQIGVSQRIDEAASNIKNYVNSTNVDTSVGLRFEMWKAAIYLFLKEPVVGVGKYDLHQQKQELVNQGLVDQSIVRFDHAHNEYLTNLSEYGIIGFVLLMFLYLVPLRLFMRKARQYKHDWRMKCLAMAGVLIPMCYMDFALTQSMFSHNSGVMIYTLAIIIFWSALRSDEALELTQRSV
ncbi:MAG: hypothetical protein CENE_00471 [Candidatus Celerinatantimonas neptuna]|nr:MAG: hypothetical protein CENE_00471 [Candidatus Celerinatantimonas neptuna]